MVPYSIYLHIPFCTHRCAYCDFNTYAGLEAFIPAYVRALCREIEISTESASELLSAHTIFFGGGTPSLLPASDLETILSTLAGCFRLTSDVEITLEANPGTLSPEYLRLIRHMGVNRLSLGVQSAHAEELHQLERQHDFGDVIQSVRWARKAGFENINLDLIFGIPYQSLESWQRTLKLAIGLQPEHLSLYALTLEHGTPMQRWVQRGLMDEPDADLAAEMYEWADEFLAQAGFQQYEISNWARRESDGRILACRHNQQYWRCLPYLGYGAGAHGYAGGFRIANVLSPGVYIERLLSQPVIENDVLGAELSRPISHGGEKPSFPRTPATIQVESIDRLKEMSEVMFMGLRLTSEGILRSDFLMRFGQEVREVYGVQIGRLVTVGLLEWVDQQGERLRLTQRGRLLGNQVFLEFV